VVPQALVALTLSVTLVPEPELYVIEVPVAGGLIDAPWPEIVQE
jgi:hypothetical protein